jgi:pSer/pThr/pTyr-binding forkhead associated (FHA) protein
MPTISLIFKEKVLANYQISKGDTLLVGRNKINDIVIDNLAVSNQHAKIESDGKGFLYVDLNSENGSFVKDQLIKSYWLNDGDKISIAKHDLKFSNPKIDKGIEKPSNAINKTMQMDTKKYRELMKKNKQKLDDVIVSNKSNVREPSQPHCKLTFLSERKKDIELNDKSVRIGKDPQSDIRVKGFAVGKTSAVINKLPDGWYINYVGGLSKPRLNNKPIKQSMKLEKLDIISIGSTKLQFLIS